MKYLALLLLLLTPAANANFPTGAALSTGFSIFAPQGADTKYGCWASTAAALSAIGSSVYEGMLICVSSGGVDTLYTLNADLTTWTAIGSGGGGGDLAATLALGNTAADQSIVNINYLQWNGLTPNFTFMGMPVSFFEADVDSSSLPQLGIVYNYTNGTVGGGPGGTAGFAFLNSGGLLTPGPTPTTTNSNLPANSNELLIGTGAYGDTGFSSNLFDFTMQVFAAPTGSVITDSDHGVNVNFNGTLAGTTAQQTFFSFFSNGDVGLGNISGDTGHGQIQFNGNASAEANLAVYGELDAYDNAVIEATSGGSSNGFLVFDQGSGLSGNQIGLSASNGIMSGSFAIALPSALPTDTECMTLDASGNMSTQECGGGGGGGVTFTGTVPDGEGQIATYHDTTGNVIEAFNGGATYPGYFDSTDGAFTIGAQNAPGNYYSFWGLKDLSTVTGSGANLLGLDSANALGSSDFTGTLFTSQGGPFGSPSGVGAGTHLGFFGTAGYGTTGVQPGYFYNAGIDIIAQPIGPFYTDSDFGTKFYFWSTIVENTTPQIDMKILSSGNVSVGDTGGTDLDTGDTFQDYGNEYIAGQETIGGSVNFLSYMGSGTSFDVVAPNSMPSTVIVSWPNSAPSAGQCMGASGPGNLDWIDCYNEDGGIPFVQNGNSFGTTAVLGTNDSYGLNIETGGTQFVYLTAPVPGSSPTPPVAQKFTIGLPAGAFINSPNVPFFGTHFEDDYGSIGQNYNVFESLLSVGADVNSNIQSHLIDFYVADTVDDVSFNDPLVAAQINEHIGDGTHAGNASEADVLNIKQNVTSEWQVTNAKGLLVQMFPGSGAVQNSTGITTTAAAQGGASVANTAIALDVASATSTASGAPANAIGILIEDGISGATPDETFAFKSDSQAQSYFASGVGIGLPVTGFGTTPLAFGIYRADSTLNAFSNIVNEELYYTANGSDSGVIHMGQELSYEVSATATASPLSSMYVASNINALTVNSTTNITGSLIGQNITVEDTYNAQTITNAIAEELTIDSQSDANFYNSKGLYIPTVTAIDNGASPTPAIDQTAYGIEIGHIVASGGTGLHSAAQIELDATGPFADAGRTYSIESKSTSPAAFYGPVTAGGSQGSFYVEPITIGGYTNETNNSGHNSYAVFDSTYAITDTVYSMDSRQGMYNRLVVAPVTPAGSPTPSTGQEYSGISDGLSFTTAATYTGIAAGLLVDTFSSTPGVTVAHPVGVWIDTNSAGQADFENSIGLKVDNVVSGPGTTTTANESTSYGIQINAVSAVGSTTQSTATGLRIEDSIVATGSGGINTYAIDSESKAISKLSGELFLPDATATTVPLNIGDSSSVYVSFPNFGDQWNSGVSNAQYFDAGLPMSTMGIMYTQNTIAQNYNTTTETSIFGTGHGTFTFPANYFKVSKMFKVIATGLVNTAISAPTFQMTAYLGATGTSTVVGTGPFSITGGLAYSKWDTNITCTVLSTGSSGMLTCTGELGVFNGAAIKNFWSMTQSSPYTLDTTIANDINVTSQWGTASTSNFFETLTAEIEVLN